MPFCRSGGVPALRLATVSSSVKRSDVRAKAAPADLFGGGRSIRSHDDVARNWPDHAVTQRQ
jgi:hypothetical protein